MTEQEKNKKIDESIKKFFSNVKEYFNSLNQKELIAWILIGVGLILLILGLVLI